MSWKWVDGVNGGGMMIGSWQRMKRRMNGGAEEAEDVAAGLDGVERAAKASRADCRNWSRAWQS